MNPAATQSRLKHLSKILTILMSLVGKTVWVVGGVGVVGRGIARGLLKAGATVIVNSRSPERLDRIRNDLDYPERLIAVHGSLRPESAAKTVSDVLSQDDLHHVVAHGAVRYWTTKRAGCDETYSLETQQKSLLYDTTPEEFAIQSSQLASLHFSAAQHLVPRLGGDAASYNFVTGDGGGHPSARRSPMGELNSHHVWGLAAALRQELRDQLICRELRIGLQVNRPNREQDPRDRPLSEDIGDVCAGMVAKSDEGKLIRMETQDDLEDLLRHYHADGDKSIGPLPSIAEFAGSM